MYSHALASKRFGFNLNLLECKSSEHTEQGLYLKVLISTYWNVNVSALIGADNCMGFNLNLLECKSEQMRSKHLRIQVLISTYWNVNN